MRAVHFRTVLLGLGAAILLTFLFVQQRPVDPAEHNRFTAGLLRIKQLDAEINRDVLSSRNELLGTYDPFVQKFGEIRMAASAVRHIPSFVAASGKERIQREILRESEILAQKEGAVERFKSENAIFRTSSRYFPVLVGQMVTEAERAANTKLQIQLANLLRDMLLYELTPNSDLAISLNRQLENLARNGIRRPSLKAALDILKAHGDVILSARARVQRITESLALHPASDSIESLLRDYTELYDRASRVNAAYRFALYLSSVFLLALAGDRTLMLMRSRLVLERSNQELLNAQERYERAVRGANDGLWDWNLVTGETYFSPRWKAMLGFSPEELANLPESWLERLHPEDRDHVQQEWDDHVANLSPVFESEHRVLHHDGNYRWMLSRGMAVRGLNGEVERMAGSQTDITGNKCKDPLTGLANRLLFSERLAQIMRDGRRELRPTYAVLYLDVDRF